MKTYPLSPQREPFHAFSYSALLGDYLANRPSGKGQIHVSEWFAALHVDTLKGLDELFEEACDIEFGMNDAFHESVRLCARVLAAENLSARLPTTIKGLAGLISNLQVIAALIMLSKQGFIRLPEPIALSSKTAFKYTITESGREAGLEFGLLTQ